MLFKQKQNIPQIEATVQGIWYFEALLPLLFSKHSRDAM